MIKIAVIGAGNMGGALALGWAKAAAAGRVEEGLEVRVSDRSQQQIERLRQQCPNIVGYSSNSECAEGADIVILTVKPWLVADVVRDMASALRPQQQCICSDAAGVTTADLSALLEANGVATEGARLFYVIPNIAAEFGESMSFVAPSADTCQEATDLVSRIYGLVGTVNVCAEKMVGPGMMMASCGIAYVMRYIRAQMEGGVEMGFYPREAQTIAMQTMLGAVSLLRATGLHPEEAIDRVTTPGGTTIKGLNELDHAGFNSAVIRSLKAGLK